MIAFRLDRASPTFSVVKGPIPALKVKTISRISGIHASQKPAISLFFRARANVQGIPISEISDDAHHTFGEQLGFLDSHELSLTLRLPRYLLEAIESTRKDNVQVDLSVELGWWTPEPDEFSRQFGWTNAPFQETIPQSDWMVFLEQLGFDGGWAVEIRKPRIGGLDDAMKHLSAAEGLLSSHQPEAAVAECRKAWDRADDLLESRTAALATVVDGHSKGEPGKPSKSQRIAKLQDAVDQWTQIGPHSDLYGVTMDDALLAYRSTVSLLAYLSRGLARAESRSQ